MAISEIEADDERNADEDYQRNEEGDIVCPFCSGSGMTGNGMFEEPCVLCYGSGVVTEEELDDFDEDAPFFGRTPDVDMILANLEQGGDQVRAWGQGIDGIDFSDADMRSYNVSGIGLRNCKFDRALFAVVSVDF